jgi:pyruvate-formate lyase
VNPQPFSTLTRPVRILEKRRDSEHETTKTLLLINSGLCALRYNEATDRHSLGAQSVKVTVVTRKDSPLLESVSDSDEDRGRMEKEEEEADEKYKGEKKMAKSIIAAKIAHNGKHYDAFVRRLKEIIRPTRFQQQRSDIAWSIDVPIRQYEEVFREESQDDYILESTVEVRSRGLWFASRWY